MDTEELKKQEEEFQQLGEEIQKLASTRQQLSIQLNENEGVKSELDLLPDTAEVYRNIASALVKTEVGDARAIVDGRIEHIKRDIARTESQVEEKVR